MDLQYLLQDYRLSEAVYLDDPPKPDPEIYQKMTDEEYESWWNTTKNDDIVASYVWEDGTPLFPVYNAYEGNTRKNDPDYHWELKARMDSDPEDRPPPRVYRYAGRAFVVFFYHDGTPMTVKETDS